MFLFNNETTEVKIMLKNEKRWGYLFIAPLTLGVLMFVLVPLFYSLFVAFSEYDLINPPKFTGLENIKILLNDQYFFKSLLRSFINLISVPIAITIGLFTSVMLSKIRLVVLCSDPFFCFRQFVLQ